MSINPEDMNRAAMSSGTSATTANMVALQRRPRDKFTYKESSSDTIYLNALPVRLAMSKSKIAIGCSDVEPAVLYELIRLYELKFGKETETVIQTGYHPC